MHIQQVEKLIASGESQFVAVIPNEDRALLLRTVCAMANAKGGNIIIGAVKRAYPVSYENRYQVTGIPRDSGSYSHVENLGEQMTPVVNVTVDSCRISKDHVVFVVSVEKLEGDTQAQLKSGESWVRVDGENMRSPVKGIGEAVVGDSFIVAQKPDAKVYVAIIAQAILDNDERSYSTTILSKTTNIPLRNVNGICERFFKDEIISGYHEVPSGSYIQVTDGDRILLDELLGRYTDRSPATVMSEAGPPNIASEVVEKITDTLSLIHI